MKNGKIRVLHAIGRMNRGGAETFLMNVYRKIDRSKIQFDFAVNTKETSHFDEEIISLGGRIFYHPCPSSNIFSYKKNLKRTILFNEYDAIHSHLYGFSGIVLNIAKKLGVNKRIAHSHNTKDSQKDTFLRNTYRMYTRRMIRKNATHLLGCSNDSCISLYGIGTKDPRVKVISNGIDFSQFAKVYDINTNELREKLQLPPDAKIVGHVGRFNDQKNHFFLINIFEEIKKQMPNCHLVLVGDGPLRGSVSEYVKSKELDGSVSFLGVRKDVIELLNKFDLFLLPSLYEGLPVVLVEAQASGLHCVVSSNVTKEVDLNGGLLHYVDLDTPAYLWAKIVSDVINMEKLKFEKRRKAIKDAGFDIHDVVKRIEEIYYC